MDLSQITVWNVLAWALEASVVFIVSTLIFDALHYLLHRWGRSKNRLLRRFSRWHWVHHRFLDRKMRVHPELMWANIFYHILPEYLTSMAGTLIFLVVFPCPPIALIAVIRTYMLVMTIREEGMDLNHMNMDRISGRQGLWWVNPSYHAMHHVHPNNFYSSFTNVFDLLFGTGTQIDGRRFLITGASGAFGGAIKTRIERLGGIVETAKHGADFTAGNYDGMREKLARADVLILSHGAKAERAWDANYTTFVDLTELMVEIGKDRLTPPEVWAVGSEAEFHGDMGLPELVDYAGSKRAFAQRALGFYRSGDLLYRHIVPSAFTSAMGPGPMSANMAAGIALFLIRRGFHYVPVTLTTLAFWNYFRFVRQKPALSPEPVDSAVQR
ncbi:MAG: sterol desaturase family protein [Devosia sp.]